jgi:hypothetical protein
MLPKNGSLKNGSLGTLTTVVEVTWTTPGAERL